MKKTTLAPFHVIRYPIIRPSLPDLDRLRREMTGMWSSGQVTMGSHVRTFEDTVAHKLGVRYAVAVSSCTSGLILAMRALGITREVIVPAFTFAATAHAVVWSRCTPVFCDSEDGTLNLDPRQVEKRITNKTSAIMPVSIFGVPPRIDDFGKLARKHDLRLIYDSAQALGAKVNNRYVGGFGDAEVFSLSPTKVVTAIEGGLVTTNDDILAKRIRQMRDYGKADGGEDMMYIGLSVRMSELHAAVGLANFSRIADLIRYRGKLVALYRKRLSGLPGVRFQDVPDWISPTHNYMVIFVDGSGGVSRDDLHGGLRENGIQTKRYFYPAVHDMTAYRFWRRRFPGKLSVAEKAAREGLALPLYGDLRPEDVEHICSRIKSFFASL